MKRSTAEMYRSYPTHLGLETLSNSPQGLHGESVRDKYKAGVKKLRKELSAAVKGGKLAGYEERRLRERCRGAWRGWEGSRCGGR